MILAGNPHSVRHLGATEYFRPSVSNTFHGRDIFAPIAGHLAAGVDPSSFGPQISDPVLLPDIGPRQLSLKCWVGPILSVDHFGNIITSFDWDTFDWVSEQPFQAKIDDHIVDKYYPSYSWAAKYEVFVYRGSSNFLEISMNQGNAATHLALTSTTFIELKQILRPKS